MEATQFQRLYQLAFNAGRCYERKLSQARAIKYSFPASLESVDWNAIVGVSKKFVDKRRRKR